MQYKVHVGDVCVRDVFKRQFTKRDERKMNE